MYILLIIYNLHIIIFLLIDLIGVFSLIDLYSEPYLYTAGFLNNIHSIYLVLLNLNCFLYFGSILIGLVLYQTDH